MIKPEGLKFALEVIYAQAVLLYRQHSEVLKTCYVKTWRVLLTEQHCFILAVPR